MRTLCVALAVCLSACTAEVEEADEAPVVTPEEVQAFMAENSAKFLADNTYDGLFHVPRPPSVENETSYTSCSHTWTNVWWYGPIPAGTQWHVSRCDNGVGEYCTWIDVWLECALAPTECGDMDPVCVPTACACAEPGGGSGGECGCSGWCGNSCCI